MKSAAIAAIALLVALLLAGAYWFIGEEPTAAPRTIEVTAGDEAATGRAGTPGEELQPPSLDGVDPAIPAPRTDATEVAAARSGSLTLSATDAVSASAIRRFWVRRSDMGDMASAGAPLLSDPTSGDVALPAGLWEAAAPLAPAEFLVSAPLYQPLLVALGGPGAGNDSRRLELTRAAAIVGVVRDGASAPIPAARVTLEYLGSVPGLRPETSEVIPLPDAYQGPTLRRTDDGGRYSFDQLPPGAYRTRVERDGTTHLSDPITVQPGRWAFGDHWIDEHVRLSVMVLRPDGQAAYQSRVLLLPESSDVDTTGSQDTASPESSKGPVTRYTGQDGRATLGPLGAGHYVVFIQSDEGEAPPQNFKIREPGRSIVELEFHLTATEQSR